MQVETTKNLWLRRLLPLAVLARGAAGMMVLVKTGKAPKRKPQVDKGLLVRVMEVKRSTRQVEVVGNGEVRPRREVSVVPQVAGKVEWVNPRFIAGGSLRAGEVMFKVEQADYRVGTERALAAVARAEQALALEKSSARVAKQEWERLGSTVGSGKPSPLVLREPQLKAAQAALASAKADLKLARLNLSRTVLRAPFNCRVRQEAVDRGQYVAPGRAVGQVFGTDRAEVVVPLAVPEMQWLNVPRSGASDAAIDAPVKLSLTTGSETFSWQGKLIRTMGEIDPAGRMSRVVVAVDDPYGFNLPADDPRPELEMRSFVRAAIQGKVLNNVAAIPAEALRLGSVVWLADKEDKLDVRKVKVARLTDDEALVTAGLSDGDRVVLTSISGAVTGMKLRVRDDKSAPGELQAERPKRGGTKQAVR